MVKEHACGHPVQGSGHGTGRWGSPQAEAALQELSLFLPHLPYALSCRIVSKPREPDRERKWHFGHRHLFPIDAPTLRGLQLGLPSHQVWLPKRCSLVIYFGSVICLKVHPPSCPKEAAAEFTVLPCVA